MYQCVCACVCVLGGGLTQLGGDFFHTCVSDNLMLIIRTLWVWGVLGGVSLECFHGIGAGIGTTKLSEPDPQCHYVSCIALFVDYTWSGIGHKPPCTIDKIKDC